MIADLFCMLLLAQADATQALLPHDAKEAVNIALTVNWTLSQKDFYRCDLNGDGLLDYACRITVGEDKCKVSYYVALLADSHGFGFYLLASNPSWLPTEGEAVILMHKGESIPIFGDIDSDYFGLKQSGDQYRLNTDAIQFIPNSGCCAATFVFSHGRFHLLTTSD